MPHKISTIAVDFDSIVSSLQAELKTKNSWNSVLSTSTGQTIVELLSTIGAFSQFSIESALQEAFMETAKLSSSVKGLARTLGVRLQRKVPASASVKLTRIDTSFQLTIQPYNEFASPSGLLFNRDIVVFAVGEAEKTVNLYQGEVVDVEYEGNGLDFQNFIVDVPNFNISDTDVLVKVGNISMQVVTDGLWHYKNIPLGQDSFDVKNVCTDNSLATGELLITFGNKLFAFVPQSRSQVFITYVVTKGILGNDSTFLGKKVTWINDNGVTGEGLGPLIGGADEVSSDSYRDAGPLVFASQGRAVSRLDHEGVALSISAIRDAKIKGQAELGPTLVGFLNIIEISALTSVGILSTVEWDTFRTLFEPNMMYATKLIILDPVQFPIDITAIVYCQTTVDLVSAKIAIEESISEIFVIRYGTIGRNVYRSDIITAITSAVAGVDYIELELPSSNIFMSILPPIVQTVDETQTPPGALLIGQYSYAVSALDSSGGETFAGSPLTSAVTIDNSSMIITWEEIEGSTGYNIYGRVSGSLMLIGSTVGQENSTFTDDGSATPALPAPPTTDSTTTLFATEGTIDITTTFTSRKVRNEGS